MAVTKVPEKYRSSDGHKFPSAEEAELHDELTTAMDDYDRAMKRLCAATARTYKTADGVPFQFRWGSYWKLYWYHGGGPVLRSVGLDRYESTFRIDDCERLEVVYYTEERGVISRCSHRIEELYDQEVNGQKALVEAMRKHIAEKQAELDKLIGQ